MEKKLRLKVVLTACTALALGGMAATQAQAAPCPNINGVTTCNVVITAGPNGTFTTTVPDSHPYDGSDDNLVGVINNSGATISSLTFSGSTSAGGLFGFDGDGLQSYVAADGGPPDTTGYGGKVSSTASFDTTGPNDYFTNINASRTTGTVVFGANGIPNGGSAYFSLEGPPSVNITPTVPEPASLALLGSGVLGMASLIRRRKRA